MDIVLKRNEEGYSSNTIASCPHAACALISASVATAIA